MAVNDFQIPQSGVKYVNQDGTLTDAFRTVFEEMGDRIAALEGGALEAATINGGTEITGFKVYSESLDVASVAANTSVEQNFTVTGLTTADKVFANKPSGTAGLVVGNARVSAADTLTLTFGNLTAGAIDPGAETYTIVAIRT